MKEQPIKKIRHIFEILNLLANSGYHLILSVITFPLQKIDFKSGNFRKNRVKKRPTWWRHQEMKTSSNIFFYIVLSIVQTFTFKTWGLKLLYLLWLISLLACKIGHFGNPCIYIYIYVCISHKTKGCDIWPPLKSQFAKRFWLGALCYIHSSCLIYQ